MTEGNLKMLEDVSIDGGTTTFLKSRDGQFMSKDGVSYGETIFMLPLAVSQAAELSRNVYNDTDRTAGNIVTVCRAVKTVPEDTTFGVGPYGRFGEEQRLGLTLVDGAKRPDAYIGPHVDRPSPRGDSVTKALSSCYTPHVYDTFTDVGGGKIEREWLGQQATLKDMTFVPGGDGRTCEGCPLKEFTYTKWGGDKAPPCSSQYYITGRIVSADMQEVYPGLFTIIASKTAAGDFERCLKRVLLDIGLGDGYHKASLLGLKFGASRLSDNGGTKLPGAYINDPKFYGQEANSIKRRVYTTTEAFLQDVALARQVHNKFVTRPIGEAAKAPSNVHQDIPEVEVTPKASPPPVPKKEQGSEEIVFDVDNDIPF